MYMVLQRKKPLRKAEPRRRNLRHGPGSLMLGVAFWGSCGSLALSPLPKIRAAVLEMCNTQPKSLCIHTA